MVVPHGGKAALMVVTASRDVDLPIQYSCSVAADSSVQRVGLPVGETKSLLHPNQVLISKKKVSKTAVTRLLVQVLCNTVPPGVLLRSVVLHNIQVSTVIAVTTQSEDLTIQTHGRKVVPLTQHVR